MKRIAIAALLLLSVAAVSTAGTVEVEIIDYSFMPSTVIIKTGDTVRWTNTVFNQHSVTSGKDDVADGAWDSKRLNKGDTFSVTFDKAGEFPYFCDPHTAFKMRGVVIVED
ncbi:MAG TPA: plastocyanin/azurin family copper-binding protein [Thermodesulfobacteriota bacterium]